MKVIISQLSMYFLVVHLSLQTRNDIKITLAVGEFPILGDLDVLVATLLLRLPDLDPLFHREMLAKFRKGILSEAETLQHRAVVNGIEKNVVIGSF